MPPIRWYELNISYDLITWVARVDLSPMAQNSRRFLLNLEELFLIESKKSWKGIFNEFLIVPIF